MRDFDEEIDSDEAIAKDYGYCSDSDLEETHYENYSELANKGKVVKIPDLAFVT